MGTQPLTTGEYIMEKMIEKFSQKYDVPTETIARAFLSCPPEKVGIYFRISLNLN